MSAMDTAQPQSPEEKAEARRERLRAKSAARRAANPEKARAANAKHHAARDKRAVLLYSAKHRAKASGLEFSITVESLKWPTHCPVLGIELNYGYGGGMVARDGSPSLDRWNNALGYTEHNTVVISDRANRLKKDGTLDELRRVVWYAQYGRFLPPPGCEDFW